MIGAGSWIRGRLTAPDEDADAARCRRSRDISLGITDHHRRGEIDAIPVSSLVEETGSRLATLATISRRVRADQERRDRASSQPNALSDEFMHSIDFGGRREPAPDRGLVGHHENSVACPGQGCKRLQRTWQHVHLVHGFYVVRAVSHDHAVAIDQDRRSGCGGRSSAHRRSALGMAIGSPNLPSTA